MKEEDAEFTTDLLLTSQRRGVSLHDCLCSPQADLSLQDNLLSQTTTPASSSVSSSRFSNLPRSDDEINTHRQVVR